MKSPLHVLDISETKENYSSGFKMNNTLDGYILYSQPSRSAAGNVAIYTTHTLNALQQTGISTTDDQFEIIWVEIVNTKAKNMPCCCAYRGILADVIVYIFAHLHRALRTEGNMLDIN